MVNLIKKRIPRQKASLETFFTNMKAGIKRQAAVYLNARNSFLMNICYAAFFLHMLVYMLRFLYALYRMDYSLLPFALPYLLAWGILPLILYVYSTKHPFYGYHYTKLLCLCGILFHAWMILLALAYRGLSMALLPHIMDISTDEAFTKNMVLILGRLTTQLTLVPIGFLLFKGIFFPVTNKPTLEKILAYKITHSIAPESKIPIIYNMNIVRDIRTGKHIPVFMKDRFLHTLVDGTSGTGKTSSTILPAVCGDLNMRCKAEDIQKEKLKEMEQQGVITYAPPSKSRTFSINDFFPIVKDTEHLSDTEIDEQITFIQKELDTIRLTYPVCGLTVMAPDDSLTDDVCRLCDVRDIPYNRIDAVRDINGKLKKNVIGMNPFYIPMQLDPDLKNQLIVKKAVIFSDVMQAITDLKGKADSYFTGLNRQMIANIAILVMVTVPVLRNRFATPTDLQELINNFDLLVEHVDKLEEMDKSVKQYTFIIQYIREDLLGKGRIKMEDQSRGTRNIINEFLLMPANKEIFCSQTSIDFDRALANGEVTVCNYNLASGDTDAIAFGLFFLLSFNNAVLSRPGTEHTRIPHFFSLDELPVLIHPSLEKNFSLFRKFRVAMMVAIQTLDQMEKNEITKYLKGVILGCAHIIVFGRSSLSDMEIFSSLAGVHDVLEEQTSTTETSLTDESPHFSFSAKEMSTQKNILEEINIRMKDFQEVTFFTTQNGRPLPPIHGKVDFLSSDDWEKIERNHISFNPSTSKNNITTPGDILFDEENAKKRFDLLPGSPFSVFRSAETFIPSAITESETPDVPTNSIPVGSESIDDII